MKVIYIHQYFRTPDQGGAVRSYHLAKGLVNAGIDVEMITAHNFPDYDQRWIDGIRVHYLPVKYDQKYGFLKRIRAFWKFVLKARRLIKKLPRPDLLYITSTPLTTGLIGLWAKKQLALPYIFEVRDLWPEAPIQVGAIRNPVAKSFLYRLEKRIYDQALSLVALSPGIIAHLQKVSPNRDVALIPNFSNLEVFFPKEKNQKLLRQLSLSDGLTIAYTGALGQVNAVEELLDLAEMAQNHDKKWNFLIMGTGSHEEDLKKIAQTKKLSTVHFIPFGSKEDVNEVLSLADFAWISFAHLPVLKTNSPNKFFDALAAGKAILVNHKGWVYDLIKTHELGISCLPGKMVATFAKLETLAENPVEVARMGRNSRKLAEAYFSKELAVRRLLEVIQPRPKATQADAVDIRTA
ncbi:glycosyltransferase family 4 protein [Algoriphagus boritolerans]|uniref:Glycosyltransferase involved in cell wall bisynthesis n=1 Tax=Algoriphagus boritolerans DSM 17298 = JCM 18970 TaxID=1120964 RepID=A0A1H5V8U3_9BACT|nr:glycosyltransferase family 4 protein [Algoriphagus boritolerans]SEF83614.1 Glycosyltransferase involved in cell wall bisynthesis [Algoriphagus boritolerans DSM 17298 = JCM 18970]